jgi:hypothetical protein
MDSAPTPQPPTLESVFAFLRTDEWKVLVKVFEYHVRGANKKNIRAAAPFWTDQRILLAGNTHAAWETIIAAFDSIRQCMWDLQEYIASRNHYYIRSKCDHISQNIVMIVNDYAAMHEGFTTYLQHKKYDTVKMKYFKQGPNGLWGGVHVKCGKLFGDAQELPLLSFLHRIHDVFVLPPDPDAEGYHNNYPHRCTWPDTAAIPDNFRYRQRVIPIQIDNPDGTPVVAVPVPIDDGLVEHGMRSDSSGDERDDEMRTAWRHMRIGNDSDEEIEFHQSMFGESDSDSSHAQLTTMLHDLNQLSVS